MLQHNEQLEHPSFGALSISYRIRSDLSVRMSWTAEGDELVRAAEHGDLTKVQEILLDPYVANQVKNMFGKVALRGAAKNGHVDVVCFIINEGHDINSKDTRSGKTALMLAAEGGHADSVKVLQLAGNTGYYGHTAREKFGHNLKYCGVVRTDAGFSWDAASARLGKAAGTKKPTVEYLENTVPDYPCDKEGNTLLHYAVAVNNVHLVQTLLQWRKLDILAQNNDGDSCLDLATSVDVRQLLLQAENTDTREDTSSENCDDTSSLATSQTVSVTEVTPTTDSAADKRASSVHSLGELSVAYEHLVQQATAYRDWKARFDDVQVRFDAARAAEPKVWSLVGLLGMERKAVLVEQKDFNLFVKDDNDIQVKFTALRQQLEFLCAALAQREAWEELFEAGTLLESWATSV